MKLHSNQAADALYLCLDDSTIVLDYNEANQIAGVEMLHLSKRSPNLNLSTLELIIS